MVAMNQRHTNRFQPTATAGRNKFFSVPSALRSARSVLNRGGRGVTGVCGWATHWQGRSLLRYHIFQHREELRATCGRVGFVSIPPALLIMGGAAVGVLQFHIEVATGPAFAYCVDSSEFSHSLQRPYPLK
jgi:hypothetical protein